MFTIICFVYHEMSKHIDITLHFISDIISAGEINIEKISTQDNPFDMLTKSLPTNKFKNCLQLINMGQAL